MKFLKFLGRCIKWFIESKYKAQLELLVEAVQTFKKADGNEEKGKLLKVTIIKLAEKNPKIEKAFKKTVARVKRKLLNKIFGR